MDIKVDVKAEDVEQAVKDAIIKSSIGQMIERKVKDATADYNLNRAVDDTLKYIVAEHVRMLVSSDKELAAKIKTKIVERLNDEFIDAIANKIARAIEREY